MACARATLPPRPVRPSLATAGVWPLPLIFMLALLVACSPAQPRKEGPGAAPLLLEGASLSGVAVVAWAIDDTQPRPSSLPGRFTATNQTASISELLEPFAARAVGVPARVALAWQQSGFRMYAVPTVEVEKLQQRLRLAGPVQRRYFAMTTQWSQAFRGPHASSSQTVMFADGPTDINKGAFRLLMRCYAAPAAQSPDGARTVLRLDLVPQHVGTRQAPASLSTTLEQPESAGFEVMQGTIFNRLLCEVTLEANESLVLVSQGSDAMVGPTQSTPFGPQIPDAFSLADAMFSDILAGGTGRLRIVLAFVPEVQAASGR